MITIDRNRKRAGMASKIHFHSGVMLPGVARRKVWDLKAENATLKRLVQAVENEKK